MISQTRQWERKEPAMTQLRISAKTLGALALPSFCPRCFWLKMKLGNKLPWAMFPGIFSSIDSFTKNLVYGYFEANDVLPRWLDPTGELGRPIPCPGSQRFFVDDPATGIRLTGAADAIIRTLDGEYLILDFKTARYSRHQDELLPMYQVQLNGYAYIAQRTGLNPVTGIGLVYCEPVTKLTEEQLAAVVKSDGFFMPFKVKGVALPLDPEAIIPRLLRKAKDILDLDRPPQAAEGCSDCQRLAALAVLTREVSD